MSGRARPFKVLGMTLFVVATIAVACTDEVPAEKPRSDAGGTPATLGDSVCPNLAPTPGERCLLPEGTTCAFGACGSSIAQCTLGAWRYSGNPDSGNLASQPCPKDFPASESACPPCWPSGLECTYGSSDCSAADASANRTVASCVADPGEPLRWSLRSFPCGIMDAGADVQGDAAPDAD
jgi:hypothetical protein